MFKSEQNSAHALYLLYINNKNPTYLFPSFNNYQLIINSVSSILPPSTFPFAHHFEINHRYHIVLSVNNAICISKKVRAL